MDKQYDYMDITRETLSDVGVDPDFIIDRIRAMNAIDVKPEYVKGYFCLLPVQPEPVST